MTGIYKRLIFIDNGRDEINIKPIKKFKISFWRKFNKNLDIILGCPSIANICKQTIEDRICECEICGQNIMQT